MYVKIGVEPFLAVSELLNWPHSVVVNDIKGDLFLQTAGYRSLLGPVFVIDPTGIGHHYDPLQGRETEDELDELRSMLERQFILTISRPADAQTVV